MEDDLEKEALRSEIALLTGLLQANQTGKQYSRYSRPNPVAVYHPYAIASRRPLFQPKHGARYYTPRFQVVVDQSRYKYQAPTARPANTSTFIAKHGQSSTSTVTSSVLGVQNIIPDLKWVNVRSKPSIPVTRTEFVPASSIVSSRMQGLNRKITAAAAMGSSASFQKAARIKSRYRVDRREKLSSLEDKYRTPEKVKTLENRFRVDRREKPKPFAAASTKKLYVNTYYPHASSSTYVPTAANKLRIRSPARISRYSYQKIISPKRAQVPAKVKTLRTPRPGQSKSIVNISGATYVTKNDGKSLQRIRLNSITPFSFSQSQSRNISPAKRIANRALQRSKKILPKKRNENCIYFDRLGSCKRGDACRFVHKPKVDGTPKKKSFAQLLKERRCRFFVRGTCSRKDCHYLHLREGPKVTLSPFKKSGLSLETFQCVDIRPSTPKRKISSGTQKVSPSPKQKAKASRYFNVIKADPKPEVVREDEESSDSDSSSEEEGEYHSDDEDSENYESGASDNEEDYESDDDDGYEAESESTQSTGPVNNSTNPSPLAAHRRSPEVEMVSTGPTEYELRRQRLLGKVAWLKKKYVRPLPDYVPLEKS